MPSINLRDARRYLKRAGIATCHDDTIRRCLRQAPGLLTGLIAGVDEAATPQQQASAVDTLKLLLQCASATVQDAIGWIGRQWPLVDLFEIARASPDFKTLVIASQRGDLGASQSLTQLLDEHATLVRRTVRSNQQLQLQLPLQPPEMVTDAVPARALRLVRTSGGVAAWTEARSPGTPELATFCSAVQGDDGMLDWAAGEQVRLSDVEAAAFLGVLEGRHQGVSVATASSPRAQHLDLKRTRAGLYLAVGRPSKRAGLMLTAADAGALKAIVARATDRARAVQ
jgi:hypothetical protein